MNNPADGTPDRLLYAGIEEFAARYDGIGYMEFDYHVVHHFNLFALPEDLDLDAIDAVTRRIARTIPSMLRIFESPTIHLRETEEIVPIEAVTRIDGTTLRHAAAHSEVWSGSRGNGIRPERLLTRKYEDDYATYENTVFAAATDRVLAYLRANIRALHALRSAGRRLEFDLLERADHIQYYLALGKLHTGYIRELDRSRDRIDELYGRMLRQYSALNQQLDRPVYRFNRGDHRGLRLHSTNILKMQKDYHRVYLLCSFLNPRTAENAGAELSASPEEIRAREKFPENYFLFCFLITVFAAGHFGFECPESEKIRFRAPDVGFFFTSGGWFLRISQTDCGGSPALLLEVTREGGGTRRTLLIPQAEGGARPDLPDGCDELLRLVPTDTDGTGGTDGECVTVSVTDIESFRRLQRVILRSMVLTDLPDRPICPFCGGSPREETRSADSAASPRARLRRDVTVRRWVCPSCRMLTEEILCPNTGRTALRTDIQNRKPASHLPAKNSPLIPPEPSALLHYRNIAALTPDGEHICPVCGKVH